MLKIISNCLKISDYYKPNIHYLILVVGVLLSNCTGASEHEKKQIQESISAKEAILPDSTAMVHLTGKALAEAYCQNCHALPDPSLLDKTTWQKRVLPQMALRLGLNTANINPFVGKSTTEVYKLLKAGIFPQKSFISRQNWQKIEDYYVQSAPNKLELPKASPLNLNLDNFDIVIPDLNKGRQALTTLVKYEPISKELWIGDLRNWLFRLDKHFKITDSVQVDTPPVDLIKVGSGYKVVCIGSIVPSDEGYGRVYQTAKSKSLEVLFSGLHRPVHISEVDLNQDKLLDLVVCNYGYNFGSLVWYQNLGKGKFKPVILKDLPGARKAEITDLNHDGRPDIVAMFAQGTETIKGFYNQGQGLFKEVNLIQFPPVYGLTYFELVDFNHDGQLDIILTNGDNADYSPILKPYHGIRIFLNDKQNKFQEKYFYPMPGATKAIARDFDKDGDLDIAAIAYFADFNRAPEQGFIYLQQNNNFNFNPKAFRQSQVGRWFTMDAGDFDQDGDEDIIVGSFTKALTPAPAALQKQWNNNGPSSLILTNTLIR